MRWLALSAASALLLRNQLFSEASLDTSTSCSTDPNQLKLKLVQIVFRCVRCAAIYLNYPFFGPQMPGIVGTFPA